MEEPQQKKKTRRKLRSTQEFNQLNRQSVLITSAKTGSGKKLVAKKKKDLFYLPKIELNVDLSKENYSPNTYRGDTKWSATTKKRSRSMEAQNIDTSKEIKRRTRSMKNKEGTSTEEEKRDSEIEFKKIRKRKKKNQANAGSDTASSSEATSEIEQHVTKPSIFKEKEKKRKTFSLENTTFDICELPAVTEPISTKKSMIHDMKHKNSVEVNSSAVTFRTSKAADESYVLNRKSVSTMTPDRNCTTKSNVVKNAIQFSLSRPSLSASSKKSVAFNVSENKTRKSKSVSEDISKTLTKSPHISRMSRTLSNTEKITPLSVLRTSTVFDEKNNSVSKIEFKKTKKSALSFNNFSGNFQKKSVSFSTPPNSNKTSKASFKKSPYVHGSIMNISSSSCETSPDQNATFQVHSKKSSILPSPIKPLEHVSRSSTRLSNIRKCTLQYELNISTTLNDKNRIADTTFKKSIKSYTPSQISQKKSVLFCTPQNNKKTSKASFKKSPYVRGSYMNESISSTESSPDQNAMSDVPYKKSSTWPSPIKPIEPSIIDLISPSPTESHPQKSARASSYSFRRSSSADGIASYVSGTNKYSKSCNSDLKLKVSKRRQWDRSSGVQVLDNSGMINSVSSPWQEKRLTYSDSCAQDSESSSPEKVKSSTRRAASSKLGSVNKSISSGTRYEDISPIKPATLVTKSLGDSTKLESSKSVKVLEEEPSTSKNSKIAVKRTRLPNFARIHQRAYEQMENVKEMSERKAARAHQLLSGKKPGQETNLRIPTSNLKVKSPTLKIKSPKSRKLLRYSPNKRFILETKKTPVPSPSPSSSLFDKHRDKLTPSRSNPKVTSKNSKVISKSTQKIPIKSCIPKPIVAEKKVLSKLGFKAGLNGDSKVARHEQIKAAASKTQVKKDSLETRRNLTQHVRTNRRFELLMKMRNKK